MIYLRKLLDMFFLSMVPSLISFLLMSQFMNYITWLLSCIISVLIFFIGNALLIRRFVLDIKSPATYYIVWLITFVVYTAGGAVCLWQDWMYPFTWIYFHTRIIQISTIPTTEVETWISYAISMAAFLALILIGRPIFYMLSQKENARREADEREEYHYHHHHSSNSSHHHHSSAGSEHYHRSSNSGYRSSSDGEYYHHNSNSGYRSGSSNERRHHRSSDEKVYSVRYLKKMEKLEGMESSSRRRKHIRIKRASGRKTTLRIKDFILSIGSYAFYQSLAEKVAMGNAPGPIIKSYLRRKLNLGIMPEKRK